MAASVSTPTNGVTRALVILLGVSVLLNLADRGTIAVAAPVMKGELGLTATAFGTAVSAFFWVYAPVQIGIGWLCDRYSVYRLMALGVVIWAVGTFLMGFAGGFLSLLVLRIMLGVGESIAFPGSSKIIARHVPAERRGIANSTVAVGIALGPAIGTFVGGLMVAWMGWRSMFMAFGLVTLVWLLPWQQVTKGFTARPDEHDEQAVPIRTLFRCPSLWAMGIGHFTINYGFYFVLAWLPLYLVQQRGLSIERMTLVATLAYSVQAVAALTLGYVSDRWTRSGRSEAAMRRAMLIGGSLALGASILGISLSQSIVMVGISLCIACAGQASASVNLYCVAQMFAGRRAAGNWVGVQNAMGNFAGIVGPIISGMLIDRAGYGSAFALAAGIVAFGGIWWALVLPNIRRIDFDQ